MNDSAPYRNGDRLRPIAGPQLLHEVLDVHFHRLLGDEELFRDVTVSVTAADLEEDLNFARDDSFIA